MVSRFALREVHELETADGELYTLSGGRARWLMAFSGFGMPPAEYSTERGFGQDGVTVTEQHIGEREISLVLDGQGCNRADLWDMRARLVDILRINRGGELWLRHWRADGTKREILARYGGGALFQPLEPGARRGLASFSEEIRLLCADPIWYGAENSYAGVLSISSHWVWPFVSPAGFLAAASTATVSLPALTYAGTYKSWPTLAVTGPASAVRFNNNTLGTRVAWVYPVPAGETVTIELSNLGAIISSSLGDAFALAFAATLTADSEPLGVYIAPAPEAAGGLNNVSVVISGASATSALALTFTDRWMGI